jgi:methylated-DNA-[protein]-cysteine S-methyltransferase
MADNVRYTVFKTKWGYFGLAANEKGLLRTILPCPNRKTVEKYLLGGLSNPQFEENLLKPLQDKIVAYFEGKPVRFDMPYIDSIGSVTQKVLAACGKIPTGKTISYSQLADMIGKPHAGRAVGNALARNPIPLVIPCHRIIRCDGKIGNFSAPGGSETKKKLLALEKR